MELACSVVPETVEALKEEIEEQYNIPMEMQSIVFQAEPLVENDAKLRKVGLKNRDTLEVMWCLGR